MEVLTDSKSRTPVLLPNTNIMKMLEKEVRENKKRMAKEASSPKNQRRNNLHTNKNKNKFEHRDWIQEQVLDYLKSTPCVNIPISKLNELKSKCMSVRTKQRSPLKSQQDSQPDTTTTMSSATAMERTTGYGLTEAEAIQIVNFMPTEPVEIHLMVEDLHARMSEAKQEEFLDLIKSYNSSLTINNDSTQQKMLDNNDQREKVVEDSIESLERMGFHTQYDDDVMIKQEI